MLEPFCPSDLPMRSFDSLGEFLRMDNIYTGSMFITSDGHIGFEASPYRTAVNPSGFHIEITCSPKPCIDRGWIWKCKQQKKEGKCKKNWVSKNCQSTCNKCRSSTTQSNLPQQDFSMETTTTTTTKLRSWGGNFISHTWFWSDNWTFFKFFKENRPKTVVRQNPKSLQIDPNLID